MKICYISLLVLVMGLTFGCGAWWSHRNNTKNIKWEMREAKPAELGDGTSARLIRMNPMSGETESLVAVPTSAEHQRLVWLPVDPMDKVWPMYKKWGQEQAKSALDDADAALSKIPESAADYASLLKARNLARQRLDGWQVAE